MGGCKASFERTDYGHSKDQIRGDSKTKQIAHRRNQQNQRRGLRKDDKGDRDLTKPAKGKGGRTQTDNTKDAYMSVTQIPVKPKYL